MENDEIKLQKLLEKEDYSQFRPFLGAFGSGVYFAKTSHSFRSCLALHTTFVSGFVCKFYIQVSMQAIVVSHFRETI